MRTLVLANVRQRVLIQAPAICLVRGQSWLFVGDGVKLGVNLRREASIIWLIEHHRFIRPT